MSVFVIGDLHLSLSGQKPMDIFPGWENYLSKLEQNWRTLVAEGDTVVVAGDISWAMRLEDCLADFTFLEKLPGAKLLMKGNHDYWWTTRSKMDQFFRVNGLNSLTILHNNAIAVQNLTLCGSRGWLFEEDQKCDPLIVAREAGRIRRSLEQGMAAGEEKERILFLHYPPINGRQVIEEYFDIMEEFGVCECYYGHLHGAAVGTAWQKEYRGVKLRLVSADSLGFAPLKIR